MNNYSERVALGVGEEARSDVDDDEETPVVPSLLKGTDDVTIDDIPEGDVDDLFKEEFATDVRDVQKASITDPGDTPQPTKKATSYTELIALAEHDPSVVDPDEVALSDLRKRAERDELQDPEVSDFGGESVIEAIEKATKSVSGDGINKQQVYREALSHATDMATTKREAAQLAGDYVLKALNDQKLAVKARAKAVQGYEKARQYIDSADDAPSDVNVKEGPHGAIYYDPAERGRGNNETTGPVDNELLEMGSEELQRAMAVDPNDPDESLADAKREKEAADAVQRIAEKVDAEPDAVTSFLKDAVSRGVDDPETLTRQAQIVFGDRGDSGNVSKGRRYISDESEAPDDATVQEGSRGGLYYETGNDASDDGTTGATDNEQVEAAENDSNADLTSDFPQEAEESGVEVSRKLDSFDKPGRLDDVMDDEAFYDFSDDVKYAGSDLDEDGFRDIVEDYVDDDTIVDGVVDEMVEDHGFFREGFDSAVRQAARDAGIDDYYAEEAQHTVRSLDEPDEEELRTALDNGTRLDDDEIDAVVTNVQGGDAEVFPDDDILEPNAGDVVDVDGEEYEFVEDDDTPHSSGGYYVGENGEQIYPQHMVQDARSADDFELKSTRGAIARAIHDAVNKDRRYVSDPDDAPDDVEVQEGNRGGYYYNTDDLPGEDDAEDVDDEEGAEDGADGADGEGLGSDPYDLDAYEDGESPFSAGEEPPESLPDDIDGERMPSIADMEQMDEEQLADVRDYFDADVSDEQIAEGDPEEVAFDIAATAELGQEGGAAPETEEATDAVAEVVVNEGLEDVLPEEDAGALGSFVADTVEDLGDADAVTDAVAEWVVDNQLEGQIPFDVTEEIAEEIAGGGDDAGSPEATGGAEETPAAVEDAGLGEEWEEYSGDPQAQSDIAVDALEEAGEIDRLYEEAMVSDASAGEVAEMVADDNGIPEGEAREILTEQLATMVTQEREEAGDGDPDPEQF